MNDPVEEAGEIVQAELVRVRDEVIAAVNEIAGRLAALVRSVAAQVAELLERLRAAGLIDERGRLVGGYRSFARRVSTRGCRRRFLLRPD